MKLKNYAKPVDHLHLSSIGSLPSIEDAKSNYIGLAQAKRMSQDPQLINKFFNLRNRQLSTIPVKYIQPKENKRQKQDKQVTIQRIKFKMNKMDESIQSKEEMRSAKASSKEKNDSIKVKPQFYPFENKSIN